MKALIVSVARRILQSTFLSLLLALICLHGQAPAQPGRLDGGLLHSLQICDDGTAMGWGQNWFAQCGHGNATAAAAPGTVTGLSTVVAVSGGYTHSMALKADGTVWSWGDNNYGQLGEGGNVLQSLAPVQTLTPWGLIVDVSAGAYHGIALSWDGTVWTWGMNRFGQLGMGDTVERSTPVQITAQNGFEAVAAGFSHNVLLRYDGTVWTFGRNEYGQLGMGDTVPRHIPTHVPSLSGVVAIAAGDAHSLALLQDGTVMAWGFNSSGQCGDSSTVDRYAPVAVRDLDSVIAMAVGSHHSYALLADSTVWAWGSNTQGQLGVGSMTTDLRVVQVAGLSGVTAIGSGGFHGMALLSDGQTMVWGENLSYQLAQSHSLQIDSPVVAVGVCPVATAVDEVTTRKVTAYPNPFTDRLTVDLGGQVETAEVTVLDIQGRTVDVMACTQCQQVPVEFSGPAGIYLLRVHLGGPSDLQKTHYFKRLKTESR
jgi:alpha-tubulin suppressor-like RCC1 family protein